MQVRYLRSLKLLGGSFVFSIAAIFFFAPTSQAATILFSQITSNGTENPSAQLSAEVSDSSGQVLFEFINANISGALASRISEVYWDDDLGLLSNGPVVDASSTSAGVNLSMIPATPNDLPSGGSAGFMADYSAGRASGMGGAANGVDPGEQAGFLFDGTLSDVLDALDSGDLRLGMHVTGIGAGGKSESLVSGTVPEPTSLLLVSLGVVLIFVRRVRTVR